MGKIVNLLEGINKGSLFDILYTIIIIYIYIIIYPVLVEIYICQDHQEGQWGQQGQQGQEV